MHKYSSYIVFLLLSILVVILYLNDFGPIESLQQSVHDTLSRVTASKPAKPNVILVEIDQKSIEEYGEWPWNRDLIADLVAATAAGEPSTVVLNLDLSEDTQQDSAGYTRILAGQLGWIDNMVMPYDIALATYRSNKTNNPDFLFNNSLVINNPLGVMEERSSLQVRKVFLPAEKLLETHALLGFDYMMPDDDRVLRHEPLVMNFEGFYYPSLSLLAAAAHLGVPSEEIQVVEGELIRIGKKVEVPINAQSGYFVNFHKPGSFTRHSAAHVLSDEFNRTALKGKIVVIGLHNAENPEYFETPVNEQTSKMEVRATVIANITNGSFLLLKENQPLHSLLLLFFLGGLCAFVMPQLKLMSRILVLLGGLIILAALNYIMANYMRILPETMYIALELVLFLVAAPMLDTQLITGKVDLGTLGESKMPKVDLPKRERKRPSEPLFEEPPVREVKSSPDDPENVETVSVDSDGVHPEDHQDISRQLDIEETAANPELRSEKIKTAVLGTADTKASQQPEIITPDTSAPDEIFSDSASDEIVIPDTDAEKQPAEADDSGSLQGTPGNLGRYQITGSLGKGAMGMVYKGVDPAINRPVALKTIRLDFVNDPNELAELKERLHREAQAAGKLSHPNIVTIYDVGSEGSLQFIAMECLEGRTLEEMIKKKVQFNYRIIAQIIVQICHALQYAHELGIVHRDIKPANIMVLKDYRVKVMDYGIARIDSNSMTKTGIAMGTPNYISPEQLKGRKSDHRADIFSLGVVMYEMLLGKRPFKGENITSLIYAIINNEPEKPSNVNPQIPLLFDHIIMKALQKDPAMRYQKASEIATALADFVESFAAK